MKPTTFQFPAPLEPATFIKRPNRFLAHLQKDGEEIKAHVPDPGRLKELLIPGADVMVQYNPGPTRKTDWTLTLVKKNSVWVCVNTTIPNHFVYQLLLGKKLPEFAEYDTVKPEVTHGKSRFDFRMENDASVYWLEVKSVSLVHQNIGLFPDAPTTRGERHLRHLIEIASNGDKAGVLFMVQRSDAKLFAPNWITDPNFSQALVDANAAGVQITIYTTQVTPGGILLGEQIEYDLETEYRLPEDSAK